MRLLLTTMFFMVLSHSVLAEKLYPLSTAGEAPGFTQFEAKMTKAIREKDLDFFRAITKDSKLGFGGARNIDEMFDMKTNKFWYVMSHMLKLGGVYEKSESSVYFPYVTHVFPEKYDAFRYAAITGTDVNVRSAPSKTATVVASLSYDIVKVRNDVGEYTEVTTPSGIEGYIYQDYIYRPIGYRMALGRHNGEWKIDFLVAGD
jgi:Bacterial SH3 domain